eukprot:TRINITY_DN6548_c0_g1_i1.p1 TRINITY_DN6548_c0_g1~~TRINITY_DN6548_c0_g1_i1.p1  ORF type:complete len:715 (-),score=208.71 TRINITY_DN6548_c0_g1_i1:47-2191(-)
MRIQTTEDGNSKFASRSKDFKKKQKSVAILVTLLIEPTNTPELLQKYSLDLYKELVTSNTIVSNYPNRSSIGFLKSTDENISVDILLAIRGQDILESIFMHPNIPPLAATSILNSYLLLCDHSKYNLNFNENSTNAKFLKSIVKLMQKSKDEAIRKNSTLVFINFLKKLQNIPNCLNIYPSYFELIKIAKFFVGQFKQTTDHIMKASCLETVLLLKAFDKEKKNKIDKIVEKQKMFQDIISLLETDTIIHPNLTRQMRVLQGEKVKEIIKEETDCKFTQEMPEMKELWTCLFPESKDTEYNWKEMGFAEDKEDLPIRNKMHVLDIMEFVREYRSDWLHLVDISHHHGNSPMHFLNTSSSHVVINPTNSSPPTTPTGNEGSLRAPILDTAILLSDELTKYLIDSTIAYKVTYLIFKLDIMKARRIFYKYLLKQIFHIMTKSLTDDRDIKINPSTVISWTEKTITKFLLFNPMSISEMERYTYYCLNKTSILDRPKQNVRLSDNDKKPKKEPNININPLVNEYELKFPVLYKKSFEIENGLVPTLIEKILMVLKKDGTTKEGIFRSSPEQNKISMVEAQLNSGNFQVDNVDVNICSTVLKRWLLALDPPIIGDSSNYEKILRAVRNDDFDTLDKILFNLPKKNKIVLHAILSTLRDFTKPEVYSVTKMDAKNIALMFAPTIILSHTLDPSLSLINSSYEKDFMLYLLVVLKLKTLD